MKRRNFWVGGVTCLLALPLLVPVFFMRDPWPTGLRDQYEASTLEETGARNVVSAIYLGYRAYDTAGEVIVLFLAVMGTLFVMRATSAQTLGRLAWEASECPNRHAPIMRLITSKLGPVILVFGLYVMSFGFASPGGGFQGGAVVASGIICIAFGYLASRAQARHVMHRLHQVEVFAFMLLVAAFCSGMATGRGFLANPFSRSDLQPVVFITLLNIVIGIKVGVSIGLLSIGMFAGDVNE
ncbi:MAG: MnhB domain-containing protein [Rectinemataceae bacterium]|nr:hypothetical protein [Spirochaetaceae bacterium]